MDLLKDNVRSLYFKFFRAVCFSSIIISVYSVVDTICIGRYEGPDGSAAVACIAPMWSLIMSLGVLLGMGSSVYLSQYRGSGDREEGDRYFTTGFSTTVCIGILLFIILNLFGRPLLILFGAQDEILVLAVKYLRWIALAAPMFTIARCMNVLVSNDGSPFYATIATMIGGIFNMFGDVFFVFVLDMGISGAGLATALGQVLSTIVLLFYFVQKRCTLCFRFAAAGFLRRLRRIITMGASSFLLDLSTGLLGVIFNNQIMRYLGSDALAVYGVASNLLALVQGFGYAVGEAAQPIMSQNFGAGQHSRIRTAFKYAALTAFAIGIGSFIVIFLLPVPLVRLYMTATEAVLAITPGIFHVYFLSLIVLIFNVMTTYFYQSVGRPKTAILMSLLRGLVLCGGFLLVLPLCFGGTAIWYAMPLAEGITFLINLYLVRRQMQIVNK